MPDPPLRASASRFSSADDEVEDRATGWTKKAKNQAALEPRT